MSATWQELRRTRPRARFARWTGLLAALLALHAWTLGPMDFGDLFSERRLANLDRFLQVEIVPPDVRLGRTSWAAWAAERVGGRNGLALARTLGAAVLAAALAAAAGAVLALWTSRTALSARTPFERAEVAGLRGPPAARRGSSACSARAPRVPRGVPARSVPAGPGLGGGPGPLDPQRGDPGAAVRRDPRNLDQRPARAWAAAGAPRLTAALGAQGPAALPRWLTYFFVRFETCVRESTVLGALGFVSLGHWIVQERAAGRYDEVLLLVALGSALVVAADLASWAIRRWVRG